MKLLCEWFHCLSESTQTVLLDERAIGRLCDRHASELCDTFSLYRLAAQHPRDGFWEPQIPLDDQPLMADD